MARSRPSSISRTKGSAGNIRFSDRATAPSLAHLAKLPALIAELVTTVAATVTWPLIPACTATAQRHDRPRFEVEDSELGGGVAKNRAMDFKQHLFDGGPRNRR